MAHFFQKCAKYYTVISDLQKRLQISFVKGWGTNVWKGEGRAPKPNLYKRSQEPRDIAGMWYTIKDRNKHRIRPFSYRVTLNIRSSLIARRILNPNELSG